MCASLPSTTAWTASAGTVRALPQSATYLTSGIQEIPPRKSRTSLRQRGTSGKHLGKPPYGYRCDPNDKDKWIMDEDAAPIVKRIFDLCIDGKGPGADFEDS